MNRRTLARRGGNARRIRLEFALQEAVLHALTRKMPERGDIERRAAVAEYMSLCREASARLLAAGRRAGLVLALGLALAGCARVPRQGPCIVTRCGDVCCPNDGKACPPCWTPAELEAAEARR